MNPESFNGRILDQRDRQASDRLDGDISRDMLPVQTTSGNVVSQARMAAASVVTGMLADQRAQLMNSVPEFFALVDRVKLTGTAVQGTDASRLRRLEQEIRMSVAVVWTIHSARKEATCEPQDEAVLIGFTDLIKDLTLPLLIGPVDLDVAKNLQDAVLPGYAQVMEFARCLAIDTVHHELTDARG